MGQSREVPNSLQALLKLDALVSGKICALASKIIKPDKIKGFLYSLEVSCHGLLWLAFWLVYIWIVWDRELFQMQVNFYLALIIDIIIVAICKAFFRRRRPPGNKMSKFQSLGPDSYSFPSGHVSRGFIVFLFFNYLHPVGTFWSTVILMWSIAVSISRLLLRMHYLLDIVGGYVLALINFCLISWLWISRSTSDWIIEYITDERLDGGEYHV